MSIEITRPLMTLCYEDGTPVPNVTKSTSEVEAMEKASMLGDGKYILKRPDATIDVDQGNVVEPPEPPEPPVYVSVLPGGYQYTGTVVPLQLED